MGWILGVELGSLKMVHLMNCKYSTPIRVVVLVAMPDNVLHGLCSIIVRHDNRRRSSTKQRVRGT